MTTKRTTPAQHLQAALLLQNQKGHGVDLFCSIEHGFVPITEPLLALPKSHAAWDQITAELPILLRDRQMLQKGTDLPILSAGPEDLEEPYLCRAACILGHLAHAWVRSHPEQFPKLPEGISQPWKVVNQRLNRRAPFLSSNDFVAYNWKLKDPTGPRILENMDILVKTLGNEAERVSMLTVTEILAQSGPLLRAVVRICDGVLHHDREKVAHNLDRIRSELQRLTYNSFMKLDPNRWGEHHADPIVWAKLVAPFGAPTWDGEPGFSGTETPTFQILDALFRRQTYESDLGKESRHNLNWLHTDFQKLHGAIQNVGLREWIIEQADKELEALYQAALDAYAGERGFLGMHRLKLYGYIELGFKTGRPATNGGFRADMGPRAWDMVDDHIETARQERYAGIALPPSHAKRTHVQPVTVSEKKHACAVRLNIQNQGLHYQPGDRCAILPLNPRAEVEKLLAILRAHPQTPIPLTQRWCQHLERHHVIVEQDSQFKTADLVSFLRYAQLRPVPRPCVQAFERLTGCEKLHRLGRPDGCLE